MFAERFFFVCAGFLCLALAYHLGANNATAKVPGSLDDVAILTGVRNDGEMIPLPTYDNGMTASESECRWTVSMNRTEHRGLPESVTCHPDGRVVRASSRQLENGTCLSPRPEKANYIILAVRRR